jgi:hypothetical protein
VEFAEPTKQRVLTEIAERIRASASRGGQLRP